MSSEPRQPGRLQAIVLLLQCVLAVMGTAILAPVIPKIIAHFQAVPGIAFWGPLVVTVPSLCIAICSPLAGYVADIVGRRRLLIVAIGAYGVVGVLPFFLESLAAILVTRVALGIVEALVMTISTTLIGDFFKGPERDKWLGYQTALASVAAVLLLALGGLAGEQGWRFPFLVYLSALPLMWLVMAFTWEPTPDDAASHARRISWREFPWSRVLGIYLLTIPGGMMFYIVQIQLSVALQERGMSSSTQVGLVTAAVSIGIPLGTWVFQRVSRWPVARLLALAFGIMATGFVGMSLAGTLATFLGFAAFNQLGCGMLLPTLVTWNMRQLSFTMRGRGTGLWQSILSLGPPLGPAAVTAIALAHDGRITPVLGSVGACAAVIAAGAAFVAIVGRERAQRAPGGI